MATLGQELERTAAGIPVSLRPFFQEYVLEDLDPERSAFTVIERTLGWGDVPELRPFYLAGGTGLALRLGHRISVDLDLFAKIETMDDQLRHGIVRALESDHTVERLQDSVLGLVVTVDGQPSSFFS